MPVDAGLDYTYSEVASSICEAAMTVSLISTRADSLTCTYVHFTDAWLGVAQLSQNRLEINLQK